MAIDASITRARYVALLRGSLAALSHLEPRLQVLLPEVRGPHRTELIRADLQALEAAAEPEEGEGDVVQAGLLLDDDSTAMGAMYVVEGSALGGVVLARIIDQALGLDGRALGYLRCHGDRLGDNWRRCLATLEDWGAIATSGQRARACETARAVFALYARTLEHAGACLPA